MKPAPLAVLLVAALAFAQEEPKDEAAEQPAGPDPIKLLADLTAANEDDDVAKIGALLKDIGELARRAKDQAEVDPVAKELVKSLRACKGNQGTLLKIVETLGELRSKEAARVLKRIALRKKARDEEEEVYQATAVRALCKLREPRYVGGIGDLTKNRSLVIAKSAYEGLAEYSTCKGRVRKKVATLLMKRLEMEYPAVSGQRDGGKMSGEQKKRWEELSPVIVKGMQAVCRQPTINDIDNWRQWWKEFEDDRRMWRDEKKDS